MKKPLVLIVDDEADIRELLEITLQRMAIPTLSAATLEQAKQLLQQRTFDLCLTDMRLPDGDGLDLLSSIQAMPNPMPVVVITAHGNMDTAITAMKRGAFDFLAKPVNLNALRQIITSALKISGTPLIVKDRRTRHILLGESPVMRTIRSKINKLALSQAPVYISGESGSGKELVARLIHQQGNRADKPFVAINCGAIPLELMESEFFGHKKGSFTGAVVDKKGLFQAADGGTLFLDEIADLPPSLQVKLLRAIQEKKIRPVGEAIEIPIDVRILSATHKNLADMVQAGSFRQDLYYRINVIELYVPPLRERISDIPQLADHILSRLTENDKRIRPKLSVSALNILQQYHFPGNVRELENILERALALYEGNNIEPEDLNLQLSNHGSLEDHLEAIERKAIAIALKENKGNKTAAAKQLGLSFRSFRYRLKKLNLNN
ncbi:MAG: sigma-54 dependent transcriptional regulator [Methylococcaceae bacterium]